VARGQQGINELDKILKWETLGFVNKFSFAKMDS
jgi:hypothetical protein